MVLKIQQIKNKIRIFIPKSVINFYHYIWSFIAAVKYKFPSKNIIVVGITGTKGKTSVSYLTYFLLQTLGIKTALSSSEFFLINNEKTENKSRITTPGRWFLQKFLREAVNKDCEVAILEITSEGLMQNRHMFIDFDIATFINIHPEHIEHHGGYEKYKSSKAKLFTNLLKGANKYFRGRIIKKTIIANMDDKESDYFLNFPAQQKITYSVEINTGSIEHLHPEKIQTTTKNSTFKINDISFSSKLISKQGISNILASFAIVKALETPISSLKQPLYEFDGLSGRFEIIQLKGRRVIIDYAHTPVSVEELYKNIWEIFKPKKLLCLIGAAGGHRDKWKRPVIGEIAAKYCNKIIISNEDPFDEDPYIIMKSIEQGVKKYFEEYDFKKDYAIIEDRKEAIANLISSAEKNDIVVLIGKGSEKSIGIKNGYIPWDEKEVVLEIINNLFSKQHRTPLIIEEKIESNIKGNEAGAQKHRIIKLTRQKNIPDNSSKNKLSFKSNKPIRGLKMAKTNLANSISGKSQLKIKPQAQNRK